MRFEDIERGEVYIVNYKDPNYPCDCRCHTDKNIVHCMPCCYDRSYRGFATCLGPFDDGKSHLYAVDTRRFLRLDASSVVIAAPTEEPIMITNEQTVKYVRSVLGVEDDE